MDTYSLIIIKFVLGMLCLILQINLLGKGNLAPTSAIDQVQNYVLGGIIGGIIYNSDISVLEFIEEKICKLYVASFIIFEGTFLNQK